MNKGKRIRGILRFGLLTVVSVFALYCIFGAPSFTPEMAMHRAEAQQLVGPSRIIAAGELKYSMFDHFLLGETEYGYCLYEYCEGYLEWDDVLTYGEKTDSVTLIPLLMAWGHDGTVPAGEGLIWPVFAIPESPRAVSARLTVTAQHYGNSYEASGTASLEQGIYFPFNLVVTDVHPHVRDFWARQLHGRPVVYAGVSGRATLELFDREGNLLETLVTEYPETK